MTAREVGRIGLRKLLQRIGIVAESMTPLATDPVEVTQLLDARWYDERLRALADELGRDPDSVRAEAAGYLREMAASLDERAVQAWRGFSRWLMRAYDVLVDEDQITQLRKLDRKATLAFAFSHRSYLDGMLLPEAILANRLSPALTFGGANLNFFPMGAWAKRTGAIFIRRQTKDIPVYRFVLRAYAAGGADVLSTDVERVELDPVRHHQRDRVAAPNSQTCQAGSDPPHLRRVVSPCHCLVTAGGP